MGGHLAHAADGLVQAVQGVVDGLHLALRDAVRIPVVRDLGVAEVIRRVHDAIPGSRATEALCHPRHAPSSIVVVLDEVAFRRSYLFELTNIVVFVTPSLSTDRS